ncbi:MAG TPA: SDR family oxidoreductase [Candidatus Hydrogenedentes bacterium]|nr:MAG: dTDP-4-dehydrorhamnose reductase [Candidatus Hydrogenedentes bacterium ADurb.Bin101]HOC68942.1 SDR family oxidoreductase [Candidatus Hydrogenedentota bacterium]HQM99996.1 SDR family oxidoreductase [Candidatus Hydrogenedentota bacterium]
MSKRLLLTGYGGFVAGSIVWQARGDWDVHALSLTEPPSRSDGFTSYQFDLRDAEQLRKVFDAARPDAVIHTAALADIDYCERHPEEAVEINVGVTASLATLCRDADTRMILCSTDSVFDGVKGRYTEEDAPNPINTYAETKIRAEQSLLGAVNKGLVTRLSLVMGLPVLGAGNSFLAKMQNALEASREVLFPENEIRTPVDVLTLGRALLELAAMDCTGIVHLAGSTRLNRYEMACRIAERLGFSTDLVVPTDSNAMAGRAKRPNDASLDNSKARSLLKTPMCNLDEALDLIFQLKEEQDHGNSRNQT